MRDSYRVSLFTHHLIFLLMAKDTIASLTQDKQTLEAQVAQLTPAKEQLDSLWIVLAVVFTIGVLF